MNILFTYENGEEVKVLAAEKALHDELIKNGFNHQATIDAAIVLQELYNDMKKRGKL